MPDVYHILRDDRGLWGFSTDDIIVSPESGSYRTASEALDMLKNHLSAKGLAVSRVQNHATGIRVETREAFEPTRPDITLRTSTFPELARLIDGLSSDLGMSSTTAIIQALIVMRILVDESKQGKRIAVIDDELNVEREILIPGKPHDSE